MSKEIWTLRITYEDKRDGKRHEVIFNHVVDAKHAAKVAKKLRPRYHKIVGIKMMMDTPLTDEWPSDLN